MASLPHVGQIDRRTVPSLGAAGLRAPAHTGHGRERRRGSTSRRSLEISRPQFSHRPNVPLSMRSSALVDLRQQLRFVLEQDQVDLLLVFFVGEVRRMRRHVGRLTPLVSPPRGWRDSSSTSESSAWRRRLMPAIAVGSDRSAPWSLSSSPHLGCQVHDPAAPLASRLIGRVFSAECRDNSALRTVLDTRAPTKSSRLALVG